MVRRYALERNREIGYSISQWSSVCRLFWCSHPRYQSITTDNLCACRRQSYPNAHHLLFWQKISNFFCWQRWQPWTLPNDNNHPIYKTTLFPSVFASQSNCLNKVICLVGHKVFIDDKAKSVALKGFANQSDKESVLYLIPLKKIHDSQNTHHNACSQCF